MSGLSSTVHRAPPTVAVVAVVVLAMALSSCGRYTFWQAERLEKNGAYAQAAQAFRAFAEKDPESPLAAQAQYRAAVSLGWRLGQCGEARPLLEDAARSKSEPWAGKAKTALMECPDFFPVRAGWEWTYVDAQTGGQNMTETVLARSTTAGLTLKHDVYAGRNLFESKDLPVKKADWEVREGGSLLLRFPFKKGLSWTTGTGRNALVSTVSEEDAKAKTRAGTFTGCLKVKVQVPGIDSAWKYDYYCPGVGRALTTVAGPGFEHPNTELSELRRR